MSALFGKRVADKQESEGYLLAAVKACLEYWVLLLQKKKNFGGQNAHLIKRGHGTGLLKKDL